MFEKNFELFKFKKKCSCIDFIMQPYSVNFAFSENVGSLAPGMTFYSIYWVKMSITQELVFQCY